MQTQASPTDREVHRTVRDRLRGAFRGQTATERWHRAVEELDSCNVANAVSIFLSAPTGAIKERAATRIEAAYPRDSKNEEMKLLKRASERLVPYGLGDDEKERLFELFQIFGRCNSSIDVEFPELWERIMGQIVRLAEDNADSVRLAAAEALWELNWNDRRFWKSRINDDATAEFALKGLVSMTPATSGEGEASGWDIIASAELEPAKVQIILSTEKGEDFLIWALGKPEYAENIVNALLGSDAPQRVVARVADLIPANGLTVRCFSICSRNAYPLTAEKFAVVFGMRDTNEDEVVSYINRLNPESSALQDYADVMTSHASDHKSTVSNKALRILVATRTIPPSARALERVVSNARLIVGGQSAEAPSQEVIEHACDTLLELDRNGVIDISRYPENERRVVFDHAASALGDYSGDNKEFSNAVGFLLERVKKDDTVASTVLSNGLRAVINDMGLNNEQRQPAANRAIVLFTDNKIDTVPSMDGERQELFFSTVATRIVDEGEGSEGAKTGLLVRYASSGNRMALESLDYVLHRYATNIRDSERPEEREASFNYLAGVQKRGLAVLERLGVGEKLDILRYAKATLLDANVDQEGYVNSVLAYTVLNKQRRASSGSDNEAVGREIGTTVIEIADMTGTDPRRTACAVQTLVNFNANGIDTREHINKAARVLAEYVESTDVETARTGISVLDRMATTGTDVGAALGSERMRRLLFSLKHQDKVQAERKALKMQSFALLAKLAIASRRKLGERITSDDYVDRFDEVSIISGYVTSVSSAITSDDRADNSAVASFLERAKGTDAFNMLGVNASEVEGMAERAAALLDRAEIDENSVGVNTLISLHNAGFSMKERLAYAAGELADMRAEAEEALESIHVTTQEIVMGDRVFVSTHERRTMTLCVGDETIEINIPESDETTRRIRDAATKVKAVAGALLRRLEGLGIVAEAKKDDAGASHVVGVIEMPPSA